MGLPKAKVVNRNWYLANLLPELRTLNDKVKGLRYFVSDEFTQTREKFGNLLDGISYLYYESAIVQLTWLLGKDISNSETSLVKHKDYVMESKNLEEFTEKHLHGSDSDKDDKKTRLLKEFNERVKELDEKIKKHIKIINLARQNLIAHKSVYNFNRSHLNTLEVGVFAPTHDAVCDTGEAVIELALYLFYIQTGRKLNLYTDEKLIESSILIEICKALNK